MKAATASFEVSTCNYCHKSIIKVVVQEASSFAYSFNHRQFCLFFIAGTIIITRWSCCVHLTYQGVFIDEGLIIAKDEAKNGPYHNSKSSNHTKNLVKSVDCPGMFVLDARLCQSLS